MESENGEAGDEEDFVPLLLYRPISHSCFIGDILTLRSCYQAISI